MRDRTRLRQLLIGALLIMATISRLEAATTTSTYEITINTSPLIGHPAGPFAVVFALTDGSGVGNRSSSISVSNVTFGGGESLGTPAFWGGASGSLENSVNVTDSAVFNSFTQYFAPGNAMRFTLSITSTSDDSPIPDGLTILLLDSFGARLPTLAPAGEALYGADLGWTAPAPNVFGGDASRTPTVGSPIAIDPPIVVPHCATNVTSQLTIARAGFVYNPGTERFSQTVKLTNPGVASIAGPIYLALDGLTNGVWLATVAGSTACASPTGAATAAVTAESIAPGASVSLVLQFTNPSRGAVTYTPRVLAGSIDR